MVFRCHETILRRWARIPRVYRKDGDSFPARNMAFVFFLLALEQISHEIKHQQSGRDPTSYKYRERKNSTVITPATHMGVSLNSGTPISPLKCWSFLVGKPHGLLGKPSILGNPHIYGHLKGPPNLFITSRDVARNPQSCRTVGAGILRERFKTWRHVQCFRLIHQFLLLGNMLLGKVSAEKCRVKNLW